MYQPFSHASNRGSQKTSQMQQQQQQPMNYQRVYTTQNQNQPSNMSNQQVKPSTVVIPSHQQQVNSTNAPLGNQNLNRPTSAYYNGHQQQQAPQRYSQYSQQQQKPQQYRIVNGSQYNQAPNSGLQQQPYPQNQQYYQQIPQNYQSVPNPAYSSKSSTMYSNASTPQSVQGERKTLIQQVQQQKQQQVVQQQFYSNQVQHMGQQQTQKVGQDFNIQRLFSSIQAFHIQLHNLTTSYQQTIHQQKMTIDELNKQKTHFRMEVENIYNSCRKLTTDYPTILCVVTRLPNGDAGLRRSNGANQTEKEINHMISLIEEIFLQLVQIKQTPNQQTIIPVTIQHGQPSQNGIAQKNTSVRESTLSNRADIQLKKSTENLKTIIEESREKTLQDKENSNVYSPITRAYPRGREFDKNNGLFDNEQDAHQYGSTHKDRLNTSPDRIQNNERVSIRVINPPSEIVSASKNPFVQQQGIKRQFTFNAAQNSSQQLKQNGGEHIKVKDYNTTQPDLPVYQPMFKDLYTEQEKVKRSTISSNMNYQTAPYTPMIVQPSRLSTTPQNTFSIDQFQQVKDFNQQLRNTKQFSLQTTNNDLMKLMDEQKYEQVTEYAYQTLTEIDRQIINMKATVELALSQTEMTMTKNLLLEIIESLRATVKSKDIDISNRYVQKIQKNTARLLKDKTASYSLYLYLQKITNFLKERENILNTSIQANEMSLLNQTDHSFWNNNVLDNNDPAQIIPIIEKAKNHQDYLPSTGSAFNFQFFLREELNIPSYIPMKEQQRMEEEVKQSIQVGSSVISNEPKTRFSVSPIQNSTTFQQFGSAQKPILQNQLMTESYTSPQTSSNYKFGSIQPPEYVPMTSTGKSQRPQSAQSSTILGVRSQSLTPTIDIFNSNTALTNITSGVQDFQRTNKFQNEEDLVKRATSIPSKIFSTKEDQSQISSKLIGMTPTSNKQMSEEFAHNRKIIKTLFTHSPVSTPILSAPQTKQDSILQLNDFSQSNTKNITPQVSERKIIQLQKVNSGSNEQNTSENTTSNKNYSINHLMTPGNKIITNGNGNKVIQVEVHANNNTSNLDNILNKYRVIDIERQIKSGISQTNQINTPSNNNTANIVNKNIEVSMNQEGIFVSQVDGTAKKDEESVKKSAPNSKVNNNLEEVMNRENNPSLAVDTQKNSSRQVNLKYESIIEKYIPSGSDKNQKIGLASRPALEQVNTQFNQNLSKNYSTQNILTQVNQLNANKPIQVINNNDPLQSVQTKYDIIVNQQQESLQQASLNFNIQQMQKKFYDLALKLKGEYPKNHKANTVTINQLWESGQNLSENEWQDYIVQQYNAAK